jgi:dTDP-4-dehydrorhamnose reductase
VFFSSDFVCAGKSLSYDEHDFQRPVNFCGYTKMMAEKCIYENLNDFSIIRPVLVYGLKDAAKREKIFYLLNR